MAYAAAFRSSYQLPAKYGWFLAGWAFLCTRFDTPQAGEFVGMPIQQHTSPDCFLGVYSCRVGIPTSSAQPFSRASTLPVAS
jgi:hypothetical protein